MKMKFYLLLTLTLLSTSTFSQVKFEKEHKVKKSDVPSEATNFIDQFTGKGKVKWYYEEGTFGNSYESKFVQDGHKYSIEFDTSGTIQDIEILIDFEEIEGYVFEKIKQHISQFFVSNKIQKVQIQYTGNVFDLLSLKDLHTANLQQLGISYELVVKGKTEGKIKLMEFNFSQTGELIQKSELQLQNFDNLEY
jgi:hypothetical protein